MIVYIDSSVLTRAYLPDEPGHEAAGELLSDDATVLVTGTWTRIEASGALVRAARAGRVEGVDAALRALDTDLGIDGPVTVLAAAQTEIEDRALALVRVHALKAMDAWHLAVADLVVPDLLLPGEVVGFASADADQRDAAESLGFTLV